jgi:hypothetical protein
VYAVEITDGERTTGVLRAEVVQAANEFEHNDRFLHTRPLTSGERLRM